ncbi:MAG: hypothetical protein E6H00_12950 [Bacillati bacterium ANGP1]|uniref:Uncharacterized protein n=1 Tax=Candidatus Segetimicrobium genomatis TaxID=2569760 RepID=A0A537JXV5_9BACT|nr:MAG: hypothetical protein E6H00_12950 [Terrabacteria group bacterium ANGP1]
MDETTRHHQAALGGDPFGGFFDVFTLVCAWCREVIRPGGPSKSHGICPACKRKLMNEGIIVP